MATETLRPTSLTLGTGWTGAYTDINEPVDSHDGDLTFIQSTIPATIASACFGAVTLTGTITSIKVRVAARRVAGVGKTLSLEGVFGANACAAVAGVAFLPPTTHKMTNSYIVFENTVTGSWSPASLSSLMALWIQGYGDDSHDAITFRVTAVELVLTDNSGATSPSFSDTVVFGESWVATGSGAVSGQSFSDSVVFGESWSRSKSPDDAIATGLGDIACRGCGTIVQVREDRIVYADGINTPSSWDGASASVTTLTGAKKLPFAVALRNQVFLFGEEPYMTGTVSTTSGVTLVTGTSSFAASLLGKTIAIQGVSFGTSKKCNTTITKVNGVQLTLAEAPDYNYAAANYVIFAGTGGATLQWSDEGDETSWTAAAEAVARLDGDLCTGAFALGQFLVLCKRSKCYRWDWDVDPSLKADGLLTQISDSRGLVANKSAVVVDNTAYMMDRQPFYFWVSRGAPGQPFDIGRPIADTLKSGKYAIDWNKSSCWFGWFSPESNSICWAATLVGEPYPRVAFEYQRPNIEGGGEPGHWFVREYQHYILQAVNATGPDGVLRAWLACADRDYSTRVFIAADSNKYGDMAKSAQTGTVVSQSATDNTTYNFGLHTALRRGSLVDVERELRSVAADDGRNVTFSAAFSVDIVGKRWRAGYRARATWRSINISPDPSYGIVRLDQIWANFEAPNSDAQLYLTVRSDKSADWPQILGGAESSDANYRREDQVTKIACGVKGYAVDVELELLTPDGRDVVHSVDFIRTKITGHEFPTDS